MVYIPSNIFDRVNSAPEPTEEVNSASTVGVDQEEPEFRTREWTTTDGRRCLIKDLDDDHVRNILYHLHRSSALELAAADKHADAYKVDEFTENLEVAYEVILNEARYRRLTI